MPFLLACPKLSSSIRSREIRRDGWEDEDGKRPEMTRNWKEQSSGFVANGRRIISNGVKSNIKQEVLAEYEPELRKAGFWRRLLIKRRMREIIRKRLDEAAPPSALYAIKGFTASQQDAEDSDSKDQSLS